MIVLLFYSGGLLTCPFCRKTFHYPYSLRAHMRFKCENRLKLSTDKLAVKGFTKTDPLAIDNVKLFSSTSYEYLTNNFNRAHNNLWASYSHYLASGKSPVDPCASGGMSSPSSTTSSSSHTSDLLSPNSNAEKCESSVWSRVQTAVEKRHLEEDEYPISPKRQMHENNRPKSAESDTVSKIDQNQNISVTAHEDDEGISAFRKVEKGSPTISSLQPRSHRVTQNNNMSSSPGASIYSPTPINMSPPAPSYMGKDSMPTSPSTLSPLMNRFPTMQSNNMRNVAFLQSPYSENIPVNMADRYRNAMKMDELSIGNDKLADIRNLEKNDIKYKLQRMQDHYLQLQYLKTRNPMIGKTMATSVVPSNFQAFNSMQNWCAKCNASFRMTSDLVYHMRSHHKREFDPMKKKREEKLKCQVCNETFRERHHLTRHMTSHV